MSQKSTFNQDLLIQAGVAAQLAETLPSVGTNAHKSETQVSIENAIVSLLAPFQPAQAQEPQPTTDRRADIDKPGFGIHWAAGLIRQLPANHDGRNSWLLNYGNDEDKKEVQNRFSGEAGTTSTAAPEGEICPGCGEIHTPEQEAHVERLRDLLESIFGEGSVQVIRKPETKH